MPRLKKYANDAARKAAYRKRKSDAAAAVAAAVDAAAAVREEAPSILRHLAKLRDEITRRMEMLGCRARGQFVVPGKRASGYDDVFLRLLELLAYIENELDKTGVLAQRPLSLGDAPARGSLLHHLENLRDEITRRRAVAGLQLRGAFRLPNSDGPLYVPCLVTVIEMLNVIDKELKRAPSRSTRA
jgi:hypothetical protein